MKKLNISSILALAVIAAGCCGAPKEASGPAEILQQAAQSGKYLYAMQDALCYGQAWHPAEDEQTFEQCDIKAVTGDFPAIAGFDLGGIELGYEFNLDGVNFDFMRAAALKHAERGGIVTFSWHLRNPYTGGDAWDVSSDKVVESILPGGDCHDLFIKWMGRLADFLQSLRNEDSELIPIIFRPWHENTGSWFWWGEDLCTDEQYQALWQMTYDYLAGERGLTDMLWAYSPSSSALKECAMGRYPGDDIIDIIGVDRYAWAHQKELNPGFIEGMRGDLEYLAGVAKEHNLLLAVTETGQEGQDCPGWWTRELQPALEGFPVCYVLTWRNAWDEDHPGHWFSSFPGAENEEDFTLFYKSDKTLFLNDIR